MDSSLASLKKDPTITLPERHFPAGIKRTPVDALPYAQRPGPETRSNSINDIQLGANIEKHSNKRLPDLEGPELAAALETLKAPARTGQYTMELQNRMDRLTALTSDMENNADMAAREIVQTTPLSGGWPRPRSKKKITVLLPDRKEKKKYL